MAALPVIALAGLTAASTYSQVKQAQDEKKAAQQAATDAQKQQDALTAQQQAQDAQAQANDVRAQQAGDLQRRRAAAAGGRASTLLTGGYGVTDPVPTQRKTLLGM